MKFSSKFLYLLILIIPLLIISCLSLIVPEPELTTLDERLAVFPTDNLPLKGNADIYWDEHAIPFIIADTDADCAFLLGMVHAHLRLGQLSLFRRVVQGRLAESAGPLATSVDHSIRILNLSAAVDSIMLIMPDETKSWMQHFIRGLNYYQSQLDELPVELEVLNIEPEPWTLKDILTIGRLMGVDVNWFNWFRWIELRKKPYWKEWWNRMLALGMNSSVSYQNDQHKISTLFSSGIKSGSNAFAVSGRRSADSCAIMASDPHLGLQLPNTWLIAGYRCPSYKVVGLMFPGVPMVLVGRNEAISWGGTNMRSASSDLYQLDAAETANLTSRDEKIKVRWWLDESVIIRNSTLGPILSDSPYFEADDDQIYALKWAGHQASDEFTTFLKANRAYDWRTFYDAFETYSVSGQNFLFADTLGNIGQLAAVKIPIRNNNRPDDFLSDPEKDRWQGYLTAHDLPAVFNPREGYLASANNRPVQTETPLGFFYSTNDRIDRLHDLLGNNEKLNLEKVKDIQRDVFIQSAFDLKNLFIRELNKAIKDREQNKTTGDFLVYLESWDGYFRHDARGPVAFQVLSYHFIKNYYGQRYDEDLVDFVLSSGYANQIVMDDMRNDDSGQIAAALRQSLEEAVKDYKQFSSWGEQHRLVLAHPFSRIPVFGGRYRFGDYPADGSYNSLMKTAHQVTNEKHQTFYGANSRFIACMKDTDANYFVLLGGQDGWPGSSQFTDQVSLWLKGEYIQLPLRAESVRAGFPHHFQLNKRR